MIRYWKRFSWSNAAFTAAMSGFALFMLLPIVFILNHAFKPLNELFQFPPSFVVKTPTFMNFQNLFMATSGDIVPFTRYLFNSVVVTGLTLLSVILASSMAGYALAKHRFRFKTTILAFIMLALMFAPETVAIPRYLAVSGLGITDTYLGHILPFIANPVAVFLMIQFIGQIPEALIEAAKLEGASELRLFVSVILPLAAPAVATVAILTFQAVWMDIEGSTFYMQDETMKTLAYYVTTLTGGVQNQVAGQGIAAAAGLLVFLPNLLMFLAFQKYVIQTMVHSGVKG
ncbi:carbohydrate ABC transporter permease [Paenibacillus sp. GCM10027626]|uniref:carbohydrate ABC transporter permease n=1 Tax=Paenibacillus sp. GCM10027626 TaxID=3273411 RepID=UPI003640186D